MDNSPLNWYALQVRIGDEESVVEDCQHLFRREIGEEVFVIKKKREIRHQGNWWTISSVQFPGYIFVKTNDADYLCRVLAPFGKVKRILSSGSEITPLQQGEAELLQALGGSNHMIDISIGYKDETGIHVLSGPLAGRLEFIRKIERNKRIAKLETGRFGSEKQMWVGLRLPSTREQAEEMIRSNSIQLSKITDIPLEVRKKFA